MKEIYLVGGQQKKGASHMKEWHRQKQGVVLHLNPDSGATIVRLEYTSPLEARAGAEASVPFKSSTIHDGKIYICTPTEVLIYTFPQFERIGYVSLPCFNDVHHVRPTPAGNLLVVSTGLDMVVEITLQGEVLREWNTLGQEPWERFSKDTDYRKIFTTKPHQSHPNHVFYVGDDIWATRFVQQDAICLTQPERRINIGLERAHDGHVHGDKVYFTTVDGHVVIADLNTLEVEETYNLGEFSAGDPSQVLGWCRGLQVLGEDKILVGYTRLRPTRFKENVRWAKYRMGMTKSAGAMPTRVALYDLKQRKLCWQKTVEDDGLNAIFSVHAFE